MRKGVGNNNILRGVCFASCSAFVSLRILLLLLFVHVDYALSFPFYSTHYLLFILPISFLIIFLRLFTHVHSPLPVPSSPVRPRGFCSFIFLLFFSLSSFYPSHLVSDHIPSPPRPRAFYSYGAPFLPPIVSSTASFSFLRLLPFLLLLFSFAHAPPTCI